MRTLLLASLLVIVVGATIVEEHGTLFRSFKINHGKTYNTRTEEARRFAIFRDNLREIKEHNALYEQGLVSYKKGINQFTDMTPGEFSSMLTLHTKPILENTIPYVKTGDSLPESIDWREKGHVTHVKAQGICGSCYAFTITGATEAAYYRKYQKLVSLSEQQLVDCTEGIDFGCNGGVVTFTYTYVQHYGLQSEETYPYKGFDGTCLYNASKVIAKIHYFATLHNREDILLEVVGKIGPVSAGLNAFSLREYESGIFTEQFCDGRLNHAVLIVGYGTENGTDYWLVKNSWGPSWGENGYFRIIRGRNECGIAFDNSFPVIL